MEINTKRTGYKMMSLILSLKHAQFQFLPPLSPMKDRAVTFLFAKKKYPRIGSMTGLCSHPLLLRNVGFSRMKQVLSQ